MATHLLYSSYLPPASITYLDQCLDLIYGNSEMSFDTGMAFRACLNTRGDGKLHSLQSAMSIKQPLDLFRSRPTSPTKLWYDPYLDSKERFFATLKPAHRLAFKRFDDTGVLAPFGLDTATFTELNRHAFIAHSLLLSDMALKG